MLSYDTIKKLAGKSLTAYLNIIFYVNEMKLLADIKLLIVK